MSAAVQPTASQSSMATSTSGTHTSHTSHTSVFTIASHISSLAPTIKQDRRTSLSLMESTRVRMAKDFRALVRHNSNSPSKCADKCAAPRRSPSRTAQTRQGDAQARIVTFAAYAPIAHDEQHTEPNMPRDESRSRQGFGSRLVEFLSRSRSRSRSKKRRSQSLEDIPPTTEMPITAPGGSLGRRNPLLNYVSAANSAGPSSAGAKPMTRSPSRPLSGATTVTDTTLKAQQRRASQTTPHPKSNVIAAEHHVHLRTEVLATDPASLPQKKKASIFSVAISHPRKTPTLDVSRPRPPSRTNSATPPTAPEGARRGGLWAGLRSASRAGSGSSTGGHSSRSNVADVGSSNTPPPPVPKLGKGRDRNFARLSLPPPSRDQTFVLNSPPPPYRHDEFLGGEVDEPEELDLGGRCSPLCGMQAPKSPARTISVKGKERERARGARDRSRDVADREQRRTNGIAQPRRVTSPARGMSERGRRPVVTPVPVENVASGSGQSRQTSSKDSTTPALKGKRVKHGSFDFERPVSTTGGRITQVRSGPEIGSKSATYPMDRVTSLGGVPRSGAPPRTHPQKLASSLPNAAGRPPRRPPLDVPSPPPLARKQTDSSHETMSPLSHTDVTPNSSQSGQSSSLGRSAGGRALRTMHGPFKFEPAVPPIPGSPAGEERMLHMGKALPPLPTSNGTPRSVAPATPSKLRQTPSAGSPSRSAGRGRSLDLGLSLAWAPQKVREEAVLAYGRPSSRMAGSPTKPVPRFRSDGIGGAGRLEKSSSRAASDVAREFKEALGDAAYATFKTYVHRFDADAIPLDGPYGLVSHARRLLDNAASLDERRKQDLLNRFVQFVLENQ